MLAFEQYPQSYANQYTYNQEDIKQEQYSDLMDSYPLYDMFGDGQQDFKYEMLRSMSQNMHQSHGEAAPSLHSTASAPSVPSASSSTVGSPYSGHAQPVVNQYMYPNQYINGPTILDDSFHYYDSAHYDPEVVISQDAKLNGSFVGKCADLSSFARRSSTIPVQEFAQSVPLVSSPKHMVAAPNSAVTTQSQQYRDLDEVAQTPSSATSAIPPKSHGDSVFKSPTTPASAYPKPTFSSPNRGKTTCPTPSPSSRDSFRFSYTFPPSSQQPMQHNGAYPQYHFFSQTNGNSILPIEASCSYFLAL